MRKLPDPRPVRVRWPHIYRIVPSRHPPQNFFARVVPARQMEIAWYLEGLTNDRLRDASGEAPRLRAEDRIGGAGSSIVMAPFTHIGNPSRFSDGSYGVYYAARELETAVRETAYHRGRFLAATAQPPGEVDMRAYVGKVAKPLLDARGPRYKSVHDPDDYSSAQKFAGALHKDGAWGLVYNSVRHAGGQCIAAFKPRAVTIPVAGPALAYVWDGERIASVYEKSNVLFTFA